MLRSDVALIPVAKINDLVNSGDDSIDGSNLGPRIHVVNPELAPVSKGEIPQGRVFEKVASQR